MCVAATSTTTLQLCLSCCLNLGNFSQIEINEEIGFPDDLLDFIRPQVEASLKVNCPSVHPSVLANVVLILTITKLFQNYGSVMTLYWYIRYLDPERPNM